MYTVILSVFVIIALILIGLVLIQHGKGADMGASFGSGASATLFGSAGTGGFLSKVTWGFMLAFFAICIVIANLSKPTNSGEYDSFSGSEVKKELIEASQSIESLIPGEAVKSEMINAESKEAVDVKTSVQDQVN